MRTLGLFLLSGTPRWPKLRPSPPSACPSDTATQLQSFFYTLVLAPSLSISQKTMRSLAFGLLLSLPLPFVAASKTSLRRVALPRQTTATGDDTEDVTLVDTMNIVYMANVTIGGTGQSPSKAGRMDLTAHAPLSATQSTLSNSTPDRPTCGLRRRAGPSFLIRKPLYV